MRGKTINQKIQKPIILLMIIVPLITLLLFNITMRLYIDSRAKAELNNAVEATKSIAGTALSNASDQNSAGFAGAVAKLKSAARISEFSIDTQILMFNRNNVLVYPASISESGISELLYTKIVNNLSIMTDSKSYTLRAAGKRYIVCGYKVTRPNVQRSIQLVFVVAMDGFNTVIRFTNLFLVAIMLGGIAFGAYSAHRIATKISAPVAGLCKMAEQIGGGDTIPTPIITDIRELEELSSGIQDMAARIQAYDHSRKDFLQNASHELRTPLMSIQGYAEGIANGVVPDAAKAARIIEEESKRLNMLVEELLTLSRIDSQAYNRQMQTLRGGDLLRDYAQRLGGFASKEGKELILDLPQTEVFLLADEILFAQTIMNVASNGLRYAKSKVTLSLEGQQEFAVIRVWDDGKGIDSADLPHLFERFYKGKGGNFGLGLSIAQSAVEWMGGSIRAYNSPTGGAVFEIMLKKAK